MALGAIGLAAAGQSVRAQERPTFRGSVDRVVVTAVVRTATGELVSDLAANEFTVQDNGTPRPIVDFRSAPTAASLGLLVDASGSMALAGRLDAARVATTELLGWLTPQADQVALFDFDSELRELQPLLPEPGAVLARFDTIRPFGSTSLYDAVAGSGRRLADEAGTHRALVVVTDGGENSSRLTAADVSRTASELDVPVYVLVVVPPQDCLDQSAKDLRAKAERLRDGPLGRLAEWTGGTLQLTDSPAAMNRATNRIINELRHQYLDRVRSGQPPAWLAFDRGACETERAGRAST